MFSTTPFDSCPSLYENPSSNESFLENFPTSLLGDEELLFDHLLHHQSPYDSMNNNHQNPNSNSMDSSKGPDDINYPQKEEELCHVTTPTPTTTTTAKAKAAPPREGGGKRKRVGGAVKKQSAGPTARRRTGKKDRHSKIYTAQGPRDRRMRLSLQIARKFFDLQDMLGFDKASKTIEWLFCKSKSAIRELISTLPPHKLKGSLVICSNNNKVNLEDLGGGVKEPKLMRDNAKPGYSNPVARESREKARARARQRTLEKKRQKELMLETTNPNHNHHNSSTTTTTNTPNDYNNVSKFGSASTPETVDQENQMSNSVSIIEKLLGSDSSVSSSSIYDECSYLGYTGNWVMDGLRMYPSNYGAIADVDELQVILQQQNPKSVSSTGLSGMHFQSSYPENQVSSSSRG